MSNRTALIRKIHVGCRELGLDDEARRDVQLRVCGKESLKSMNDTELQAVCDRLKELGFAPQSGKRRKAAPRADLRYVHVLWGLLGKAGALKDPTRNGLNKFIRSRFEGVWGSVPADIDMMRDHAKISLVINALKDWCNREGIALDA